jgi:hypothetical protein
VEDKVRVDGNLVVVLLVAYCREEVDRVEIQGVAA